MRIFALLCAIGVSEASVFVRKNMCGEGVPCTPESGVQKPKPNVSEPAKLEPVVKTKSSVVRRRPAGPVAEKPTQDASGNLPGYFEKDRDSAAILDAVVMNIKSKDPRLKSLRTGDMVRAVIDQEMVCSPTVPTPIRAISISGPVKGAMFLGEAKLDRELKRVLITFTSLRLKGMTQSYRLQATGLSLNGSVGLEGEYVSNTGHFFLAEMGSAFTAGLVDSSVERTQTAVGTYNQSPSLENKLKVGGATALMRTADRAAEQARTAPEYTKVEGYQEIKILISEDPTEGDS